MPRRIAPKPIPLDEPTAVDDGVQRDTQRTLRLLERLYREQRNPLWAWRAFDVARFRRVDIPTWVLQYFDQVSANLEYLSGWEAPRKRSIAATILRALGFVNDGIAPPPAWRERQLDKSGAYNPFSQVERIQATHALLSTLGSTQRKDEVAKRLGKTLRTLQRRLRDIK